MPKQIINLLKEIRQNKNETYSLIAEYLLSCECIKDLKIKELNERCHVSSSTVVRFSKYLGFNGFSELKYKIFEEKTNIKLISDSSNISISKIANKHLDNITTSLIETRDLISDDKLKVLVDFISTSETINVYAIGITYLVAQDLEFKLDRIKKHCKAYNDSNLQYFSAKNADEKTLCIGISYSGESENVIKSLETAKRQGAKTVLITNVNNQRFKGCFNEVVFVSSTDMKNRLITTTSRLSLLYTIDLIYTSYINVKHEEIKSILENNSFM